MSKFLAIKFLVFIIVYQGPLPIFLSLVLPNENCMTNRGENVFIREVESKIYDIYFYQEVMKQTRSFVKEAFIYAFTSRNNLGVKHQNKSAV